MTKCSPQRALVSARHDSSQHVLSLKVSSPSSSILVSPHLSCQMEALGDKREAEGISGQRGESLQSLGQTSVLHFLSKLRRHASLEGAGPYFRRWKFDTSHRAASLDAKGQCGLYKETAKTHQK